MTIDPRTDSAYSLPRNNRDSAHATRSDEALIAAYLAHLRGADGATTAGDAGDDKAFDVLFNRYFPQIRSYLRKHSWYRKDNNYLDELVYAVFRVAWECLNTKGFRDEGPGSFRKMLYTIANLEYYKQDTARSKAPMTTSAMFPASFIDIPIGTMDEPFDDAPEESTVDKFNRVMSKLKPDEQKLMRLVAERVPYKEILKEPEFVEYSLAALKQKIYNIRRRFKESLEVEILRRGSDEPEPRNCPWPMALCETS